MKKPNYIDVLQTFNDEPSANFDPVISVDRAASETIRDKSDNPIAYGDAMVGIIQEKQKTSYHVGLSNSSMDEVDWDRKNVIVYIHQKSAAFTTKGHKDNAGDEKDEQLREVVVTNIKDEKGADYRLDKRKGAMLPNLAGMRIAADRNTYIKQKDIEFFGEMIAGAETAGQLYYLTDVKDGLETYKDIHAVANRSTDGYGFKTSNIESTEYDAFDKNEMILNVSSNAHFSIGNVNLQQGTGSDLQFGELKNGLPVVGSTNGIAMVLIPANRLGVSSEGMPIEGILQIVGEFAPVYFKMTMEHFIEQPSREYGDLSVYSKGTRAIQSVFPDLAAVFTEAPVAPRIGKFIKKLFSARPTNKEASVEVTETLNAQLTTLEKDGQVNKEVIKTLKQEINDLTLKLTDNENINDVVTPLGGSREDIA